MQFLFTGLELGTTSWTASPQLMQELVRRQREVAVVLARQRGGRFVKTVGDGVFCVFRGGGIASALELAEVVQDRGHDLPKLHARVAVSAGDAFESEGDFFGPAVNRAARLVDAAWGGQILATERALQEEGPGTDMATVDLGFHTFGDLGPPERVVQVSAPGVVPSFPPLRKGVLRPYALPPARAPLVGRDSLLRQVTQLLSSPEVRLVTLVGPGGIGKTRLALEVGITLGPGREWGACLVPLGGISTAEAAWRALAQALHVPAVGSDPQRSLLRFTEDQRLLLVADDVGEPLAEAFVEPILAECPGVSVLATARVPLGLPQERVVVVGGLAFPAAADDPSFLECPAVRCFCEYGARRGWRGPASPEERQALHELCSLYQGMPLALELAASWVGVMSLGEVVRWVRASPLDLTTLLVDVQPEHRNLRGTLRASMRVIPADARRLLGRLSVFPGSLGREAALWLAGGDASALTTLEALAWVRRNERERYELHPLVRCLAQEWAREAGEWEDHERAFVAYWAQWARGLAALPGLSDYMAQFLDHDALELAFHLALRLKEVAALRDLIPPVFASYRCLLRDGHGKEVMGRVVRALEGCDPSPEVCAALTEARLAYGRFLLQCGQHDEALPVLKRVLRDSVRRSERLQALEAVRALARLWFMGPRPDRAVRMLRWSARGMLEMGRVREASLDLTTAGLASSELARLEEALDYHREALALATQSGSARCLVFALRGYGDALLAAGDSEQAVAVLERCLEAARRVGTPVELTAACQMLGEVCVEVGQLERARACVEEALAIRRQLADKGMIARSLGFLARVANLQGRFSTALGLATEGFVLAQDVGQHEARAVCAVERATALLELYGPEAARGMVDEVLDRADMLEVRVVARAVLVDAQILWREGQRELAWQLVSSLAQDPPASPEGQRARALLDGWEGQREAEWGTRSVDWRRWRGRR